MKVVFLQNLKGIAKIGDIKDVNDGYARNFLFPKNFAKAATAETVKQAETMKIKAGETYAHNKKEAEDVLQKIALSLPNGIEIAEDANDEGHLYGSVGEKKIVEALRKRKVNINQDQIILPEHIKTVGEHEVELELHPEVKTKIKILVSKK